MAWETTVSLPKHDTSEYTKSNEASAVREDAETVFRAANFSDILSSELVLICITSYLPVATLLALSAATKEIRSVMHSTPGIWRTIDLTDQIIKGPEVSLVRFSRQQYVARDCRHLILDGVDFDHSLLDQIMLRELPSLQSISLRCCPKLNGDQLIKLIDYIRRPSAPRPLSLKRISLLGAPLFPLNSPSRHAPIIVAAAGDEISTDLHGRQCVGQDHISLDIRESQWHLKMLYQNNPCVACKAAQVVCMKCHVKKSCVGCHSYYCDECEPYPKVPPPLHTYCPARPFLRYFVLSDLRIWVWLTVETQNRLPRMRKIMREMPTGSDVTMHLVYRIFLQYTWTCETWCQNSLRLV